MKLTKQDIKTLEKMKKMCDKTQCEDCIFCQGKECILQNQQNWWHLDLVVKE